MMTVGLTGGIGSGKSTVARLLETMGCVLYNSDERAKTLYTLSEVKARVLSLLGPLSYSGNGQPDRAYIASKVFADKALLEQLNAIIHPAVKADFEQVAAAHPKRIVIKESAILFETGIYRELDTTILVTAPLEEKIRRVMVRNGFTREEVERRMAAQWSDEQKLPLAAYVVRNGAGDALIPQVNAILNQLRERC